MKVVLLQEATDSLGIKLPVILIVIEVGELVGHIDAMEGKKRWLSERRVGCKA